MHQRPAWRAGALAFGTYQVLSVIYFGLPVIAAPTRYQVGMSGGDPALYMWLMRWWPYAIGHHINPFITRVVFTPDGFNLTWATSLPGLAILAAPLVSAFGLICAYNILCLLCPSMAGWAAFLLCSEVSDGAFLPSLFGGYLFGFSPYTIGQMVSHLPVLLIFPVPLMVLVVLRWFRYAISSSRFGLALAVLLVIQDLLWNELLATATIFGGLALLVAFCLTAAPDCARLLKALPLIAAAYVLTAVLLSPVLYYTLAFGIPDGPINSPEAFSIDLLGLIVPSTLILGGSHFAALTHHFTAGAVEGCGAYLGLPLLAIAVWFGIERWKSRGARLMLALLFVVVVASLGPRLHIDGRAGATMPSAVLSYLPLVKNAVPGRFPLFSYLILAVLVTCFLTNSKQRLTRWFVASIAVIVLLPNQLFYCQIKIPRFFTSGDYKKVIAKNSVTLFVPYSGESMLWQAKTGFYYRMAGGYLGTVTPPEEMRWPVAEALLGNGDPWDFTAQLSAFVAAHNVSTIIVTGNALQTWPAKLSVLGIAPIKVDDALVYNVPKELIARYRGVTATQMSQQEFEAAFAAFVSGVNAYLKRGLPARSLTPWELERRHLVRLPALASAEAPQDPRWWSSYWVGEWGASEVAIGALGELRDLEPLVQRYEPYAKEVYFPYPQKMRAANNLLTRGQLILAFTPDELLRASAAAPSPDHN